MCVRHTVQQGAHPALGARHHGTSHSLEEPEPGPPGSLLKSLPHLPPPSLVLESCAQLSPTTVLPRPAATAAPGSQGRGRKGRCCLAALDPSPAPAAPEGEQDLLGARPKQETRDTSHPAPTTCLPKPEGLRKDPETRLPGPAPQLAPALPLMVGHCRQPKPPRCLEMRPAFPSSTPAPVLSGGQR